jgi:hypothetical protein
LHFTYPYAPIKDVQATGEASKALKREHPALQKMKKYYAEVFKVIFLKILLQTWTRLD